MGIFKAYDIRGLVPGELDEALARKIGHAFARLLQARRLVVARDMRTHSPALSEAVIEGMRDAGASVVRVGLASTPMAYFAIGSIDCDGGLAVTASHNPGQYNGMKLCGRGAAPISAKNGILELERACREPYPGAGSRRGSVEEADVLADYAAHVARFARIDAPITVAIDGGSGMAGHTLPAILARLPNVKAHTMLMLPDGTFPLHEANPLKEENLKWVQELTRAKHAAAGIAFDGDADRCCFVDEAGRTAGADLITALLAPSYVERGRRTPILYDLRSSWVVRQEIEKVGGTPLRERVGHSFIKATMRERGARFGGELSGHFYFADNFCCDSGEIACVSLLSHLAAPENRGRRFSELLAGLRRFHASGEVNFHVADKDAAIRTLRERYRAGRQDELDGITVEFGDLAAREWWWFNVRASNTEPLLRLNLEASSAALRDAKQAELVALLGEPE
jgi:phosphomannomutase